MAAKKVQKLKTLSPNKFIIFKLKNRKGFAAVCMNNLTEGRTPKQAFSRLNHPMRRLGYALPDKLPKIKSI